MFRGRFLRGAVVVNDARTFALLALLTIAAPAFSAAADLTVFDDAIESNFSFCANVNGEITYDTNIVYSGIASLKVLDKEFYGLDFCSPVSFSATDYNGVSFWINGGASGGESIRLVVSSGDYSAYADVASLYGAPLPPNQWLHIQALFSDPLFINVAGNGSTGNYDDLTFVVESSGAGYFYFDDFVLKATDIFKSGFDSCDPSQPTC
jgi:hypothetical protein